MEQALLAWIEGKGKALDARARDQLAQNDRNLRRSLFSSLVAPSLHILRGGNAVAWNEPGWYQPHDPAAFEAVAETGAAFPVPDGCSAWGPLERDSRGTAFRFFARRAWLELPAPAGATTLSFVVQHMVMAEALAGLSVRVDGVVAAHQVHPCPGACARISVALDAGAAGPRQRGQLAIELATPVSAMPALVYPGARDHRHLSLAICFPYFEQDLTGVT